MRQTFEYKDAERRLFIQGAINAVIAFILGFSLASALSTVILFRLWTV